MSSGGVVVRCVNNCGGSLYNDMMQKAFTAVQDKEATSVWFGEDECMSLVRSERNVFYVFEDFTGEAFQKVTSLGSRIYGAPCILQCLEKCEALPKRAMPVFSFAMKGIVLSCTNLPTETRNDIHQKVEWMMGEASKVMNEKVTHLVAGEVGSKKYFVASSRKVKIVLPEWVEKVWVASHSGQISANDAQFDKFRCPVFKGLSICASGLSTHERTEIKKIVEQEGGIFSGMMKINECTHLIVHQPTGQKYQFAKEWKINIVRPDWVRDSTNAGYCLEESKYFVAGDSRKSSKTTSTPTEKNNPEFNMTSISNLSSISLTHVNETDFTMRSETASAVSHVVPHLPPLTDFLSCLDSIDVRKPCNSGYLDGCKIYLACQALESSDKIRILINKGCGTRFNQLNETISHVIADTLDDALLKQVLKLPVRPHVVSVSWLVECFKQGRNVPEKSFSLLTDELTSATLSPRNKNKQLLKAKQQIATSFSEKTNLEMDMSIMLSHYVAPQSGLQNGSELGESTMMQAVELMEGRGACGNRSGQETIHEEETEDETQDVMLFSGLTFVIFHLEFLDELTKDIERYGGQVLPCNTRKMVNIGVVPVEGCPVTRTVDEIVTTAWVNMCIEDLKLLPYDSLEIFRPITILPDCQPLVGCVFSISGLLATEKNIIVDIIKLLGGRVQDCFLRVRKDNLLACTHLVANAPEGPKFEAALKWGTPVVTKSWVFECARTGNKVLESRHKFVKDSSSGDPPSGTPTKVLGNIKKNTAISRNTSFSISSSRSSATPTKTPANVNTSCSPIIPANINTPVSTLEKTPTKKVTSSPASTPSKKVAFSISKEPIVSHVTAASDVTPDFRPLAVAAKPPGSLKNSRVQALIDDSKRATAQQKDKSASNDTPGKFLNANEYQPRFNFQNSLESLQSPAVDMRRHMRTSLPLEDVFAANINIAVKHSSSGEARDDSFSQKLLDPGSCINQPELNKPLTGVIISVAKKLISHQTEYNKMAVSLGAQYRWMYQPECTHFIFQGKQNDINREFRTAREQGKIIVSPQWLVACDEQQKRVSEALFPHTYNSSLNVTVEKTPARIRKTLLNGAVELVKSPGDGRKDGVMKTTNRRGHLRRGEASQTTGFLDGLKKLNHSWKTNKKDPQAGASSSTDSGETLSRHSSIHEEEPNVVEVQEVVVAELPQNNETDEEEEVIDEEVNNPTEPGEEVVQVDQPVPLIAQASQLIEVMWEDPRTKELIAKNAAASKQRNVGIEREMASRRTNKENRNVEVVEGGALRHVTTSSSGRSKGRTMKSSQKVFVFSGFKAQEKEEFVSLIESLGGQVNDGPVETCSHLIACNPTRSEKFLACMSSGKWVLHRDYLRASIEAGHFIDEVDYEWGSENISLLSPNMKPQEKKLARAARSWRLEIKTNRGGAFKGWKCVLLMDHKKIDGFSRLLTSGGASVVPTQQPLNLDQLTHAFIEARTIPFQVDLEKMSSMGILCLKPEYISSYLTDQPDVPTAQFLIKEVDQVSRDSTSKKRSTRSPMVIQESKKIRMT